MPRTTFERLQPDAKLWVFGSDRKLHDQEAQTLLTALGLFLDRWTAHEVPVTGACEVREGRFVLVAADSESHTSGCSIDKLFDLFQEAEKRLGVSFLDPGLVFYRDRDGDVKSVSRKAFRELAARGEVTAETPVFDNTIEQVAALRSGEWEKPAGASWHGQAFAIAG